MLSNVPLGQVLCGCFGTLTKYCLPSSSCLKKTIPCFDSPILENPKRTNLLIILEFFQEGMRGMNFSLIEDVFLNQKSLMCEE